MKLFFPDMYKKNILDINYNLLKEKGIKCLIFDLDNTIALIDEGLPKKKTIELFDKLKKDFHVIIISNNVKKRVKLYSDALGVDYVSFAMKPFLKGMLQIKERYHYHIKDMCMIGDQIMTDILSGKRLGVYSILVDPMSDKDLKITKVNRFFERRVLKGLKRKYDFEKGKYYER